MGLVSEECKEQIRNRVPLEDIIREYNVNLSPVGKRLRALCPFHAEKTPSFYVDVQRQTYHCFGCQEHGDVFRFVQRMHQVDFPQAIELLARRAGVVLDRSAAGLPGGGGRGPSVLRLYDTLQMAGEFYHRFLLDDPAARPARDYLDGRGIARGSWERFLLGYSPPEWDGLLRLASGRGVSVDLLEASGLVRRRESGGGHYDYFRGRIMFPVSDPQGRTIGFGARTLGDDGPKYLNSPRTPVFDKSQILYALSQARQGIQREGCLAIVEGYTDAIVAHQAGLDFFVASLGTAFTSENAHRLARMVPRVLLIFDGDAAGQKATERSLDLLVEESLDVRIYTVKDGKDPCDAIQALGAEEFRRRIESEAVGIFEFKWRRTVDSEEARGAGPAGRARALDEFLDLVARVPNVVARKLYVREFSERIGVSEEDIGARLRQVARRVRTRMSRVSSRPAYQGGAPSGGTPSGGAPFGREAVGRDAAGVARPLGRAAVGGASGIGGASVGGVSGKGAPAEGLEWREADLGFTNEGASDPEAVGGPGSGGRDVGVVAARQAKLEELIVECLLALPEKAEIWLTQLPEGFVRNPALCQVLDGARRQLETGAFSPTRLVHHMEDSEASRLCLELMSRCQVDADGRPREDYEEVWGRLQRDIWRQMRQARLEDLRRLMARESPRGETEALRSVRKEYFDILRELKRGGDGR